tara:strand:+ start:191 stop:517 length:327 start_codon:yes stop_codon:yes gene_type:complete
MENLKLPVALVAAMAIQLAGGVWWVSQQAATITSLEETVSQLGSRMAIEDKVNLKRDVKQALDEIEELWEETEFLWEEANSMAKHMTSIIELQQRMAIIENTLNYMSP